MTTDAIAATPQTLTTWVEQPKVVSRLQAALGDVMGADQFVAHMLVAFQDPTIAHCSDRSKFVALHECAALGLLPTLDQVRLIPYKNEVKAMPQWQGYKALMERHPDVLDVTGCLVHITDRISVDNGVPNHQFNPLEPGREFKSLADLQGGYCKITYCNARSPKYHFVSARQISKARACAQTHKVWDKWFEQMCLKTLYRDTFARRAVPIDPFVQARLQKVLATDDSMLSNDPNRVPIEAPPEPDQLAALLGPAPTPGPAPDPDQEVATDHAQLMDEYHQAIAAAETIKAVTETELHAKAEKALTEKGLAEVLLWCKQQRQAIEKAEKRNQP